MASTHVIDRWNPEDKGFWEHDGQAIARRNLWLSMPALTLAFAVWMVWSVVVVNLPNVGFLYSTNQLFWLAALPALCGATLRIFYSFAVPIFGGRGAQESRGLGARARAELAQHRPHVVVDRPLGDHQALGDLAVGQPLAEEAQHLPLAAGEPVGRGDADRGGHDAGELRGGQRRHAHLHGGRRPGRQADHEAGLPQPRNPVRKR